MKSTFLRPSDKSVLLTLEVKLPKYVHWYLETFMIRHADLYIFKAKNGDNEK